MSYTYRVGIHPETGMVALGRQAVLGLGDGARTQRLYASQLKYRVVVQDRAGRWRLATRSTTLPGETIVVEHPFRWRGVWGAPRHVTELSPSRERHHE